MSPTPEDKDIPTQPNYSTILMGHCIDNDISHEFEGVGGILRWIFGIIGPLESVAKIFVPCHQNIDAAMRIKDGEHFGNLAGRAVLPLLALRAFGERPFRQDSQS